MEKLKTLLAKIIGYPVILGILAYHQIKSWFSDEDEKGTPEDPS